MGKVAKNVEEIIVDFIVKLKVMSLNLYEKFSMFEYIKLLPNL